jgi:tetratricopeptide (TPR) repeat protein
MSLIGTISAADEAVATAYFGYLRDAPGGHDAALLKVTRDMAASPSGRLTALAEKLVTTGQTPLAGLLMERIVPQRSYEHDVHYTWAWVLWQDNALDRAEAVLDVLVQQSPNSLRGALMLAEVLRTQARLTAVVHVLTSYATNGERPTTALLEVASFLSDSRRPEEAMRICELALKRDQDPQIQSIAARLCLELGRFEEAHRLGVAAMDNGIDLETVYLSRLLSMTQTYQNPDHPDFARFRRCAGAVSKPNAKASVRFALGKAFDDIDHYETAAEHFRIANRAAASVTGDTTGSWLAMEAAEMTSPPIRPLAFASEDMPVPVFIVGMPRSGSTLLASRLSQHPAFRDRGELPIMPYIRQGLLSNGRLGDHAAMREAAALYLRHLVQDDAPAHWYLDKAPMNFAHLGLITALFPTARILWCRRDAQDTALSIWMQHFAPGALDFAYDFASIHAVSSGCIRIMAHWRESLPALRLHEVSYETLVTSPAEILAGVFRFLGAPDHAVDSEHIPGAIATSSAWQVRQPVHTKSVGRARLYTNLIPELALF